MRKLCEEINIPLLKRQSPANSANYTLLHHLPAKYAINPKCRHRFSTFQDNNSRFTFLLRNYT